MKGRDSSLALMTLGPALHPCHHMAHERRGQISHAHPCSLPSANRVHIGKVQSPLSRVMQLPQQVEAAGAGGGHLYISPHHAADEEGSTSSPTLRADSPTSPLQGQSVPPSATAGEGLSDFTSPMPPILAPSGPARPCPHKHDQLYCPAPGEV